MAEAIQSCFARFETKYFLTKKQYEGMLAGMAAHAVPDACPKYTINNIYFDTENFQLIRDSLEKPAYKEKLRLRSYGQVQPGDTVFLEMKKKLDSVVYKRRIVFPIEEAIAYLERGVRPSDDNQICKEIDWLRRCYDLKPVAFIGYDREAYAGLENPELRITFDTNLRWRSTDLDLRSADVGEVLGPPDAILMEVKFPGVCPFWLSRLMSELGVRRTSFSKYGSCYCDNLMYRPEAPALPQRAGAKTRFAIMAHAAVIG